MKRAQKISILSSILLVVFIITSEIWVHYYTMFSLHAGLRDITAAIHQVCEEHGIKYWIGCGTLLGSIREGNIIAHDDDVDLCVPVAQIDRLAAVVAPLGLKMTRFADGLYKISHPGKPGVVDIFAVTPLHGYFVYMGYARTMFPTEKYEMDDEFRTNYLLGTYRVASESIFEPLRLNGPKKENALAYLHRTYGASWSKPRILFVHTLTGIRNTFWFSVIIAFYLLVQLVLVASF